jgi:hypothetical protein
MLTEEELSALDPGPLNLPPLRLGQIDALHPCPLGIPTL